jgi:hypothetical protein
MMDCSPDPGSTPGASTTKEIYMSEDNWKGRSEGMRCHTCMFFVKKKDAPNDIRGDFGRCRRHAPTLNGWPAVFGCDWCGDHKLDENKI